MKLSPPAGAYSCDRKLFSDIVELARRRARRAGENCILARVSLEAEIASSRERELAAGCLRVVFMRWLRRGDVLCRWGEDLFLVLLYNMEGGDVEVIRERIDSRFKDLNSCPQGCAECAEKTRFSLNWDFRPLFSD